MHGGTLTAQADFNRLSERFTLSTQARAIDIAALLDTLGQPRRLEGLADWRPLGARHRDVVGERKPEGIIGLETRQILNAIQGVIKG